MSLCANTICLTTAIVAKKVGIQSTFCAKKHSAAKDRILAPNKVTRVEWYHSLYLRMPVDAI